MIPYTELTILVVLTLTKAVVFCELLCLHLNATVNMYLQIKAICMF